MEYFGILLMLKECLGCNFYLSFSLVSANVWDWGVGVLIFECCYWFFFSH